MVIANTAARLRHILHAALVCPLDIVAEGEEGVTAQTYALVLRYPGCLLLTRQRLGALGEELLPGAIGQHIVVVVGDIDVNGIVAVSTADAGHERQGHHLRMLAQPPDVSLLTGQTCAMDAALLSGTDADSLTILDIAHRIGLRVLERDKRNHQVATRLGGEDLILRGDILEKGGVVEADLVASLFKGDAEHLLTLDGLRTISGVYLYYIIRSLALFLKNLQRSGRIVRSDDTIGDLTLDEQCRGLVASIAQRNEVAIGTHAVGATGTGISRSNGRQLKRHIIHPVNLAQGIAHGQAHGSAGGRDVLEGRCCGQARRRLQLAHQLPRVQRIEEVDISRAPAEHLNR